MLSIPLILIIVISAAIFYQYYFTKRYGLWIEKQLPVEVDQSLVWKVKYLSFDLLRPRYISVPPNSKIIGMFVGVKMLDIYDHKMRHINHFYHPSVIVLEEGVDIYAGINYHVMVRYHERDEDQVEMNAFLSLASESGEEGRGRKKEIHVPNPTYEISPQTYYDESHYKDESSQYMQQIIEEMEEKDYELETVEISGIRRSFPSNMLINEIEIFLEEEKTIVVMVSNKRKTLAIEDHSLEFDSEDKKFVWNPSGDDNFSFLVLDEGENVEISIREYLYCEQSKVLPISVMTFVPV